MHPRGPVDLAAGLSASKPNEPTAEHGHAAARGAAKPVPGRKEWSG